MFLWLYWSGVGVRSLQKERGLPTSSLSQWDLSLGLWKADRAMNIWAR